MTPENPTVVNPSDAGIPDVLSKLDEVLARLDKVLAAMDLPDEEPQESRV
jgi:hypothetical protein